MAPPVAYPAALSREGERLLVGRDGVADVVANAVMERKAAGEEGGVRRQRQRALAVDILEDNTPAREAIDRGRRAGAIAVRREMIGSERIDRDEDDRRARNTSPATGGGVRLQAAPKAASASASASECVTDGIVLAGRRNISAPTPSPDSGTGTPSTRTPTPELRHRTPAPDSSTGGTSGGQ